MRHGARRRSPASPACMPSCFSTGRRRELFVARDPFGIKPLFFARGSGHLAFASEIGPLLDVPGVGRGIDLSRTCLFLSVGQTDESERTMFADVRSLPAGHFARISLDAAGGGAGAVLAPDHRGRRAKPGGGGPRVARRADPLGRASSAQRRADRHLALRRHRFLRDHRLRPRGRRAVHGPAHLQLRRHRLRGRRDAASSRWRRGGGRRAAHGADRARRDRRRHRPADRRAGRAVRQPLHVCAAPRDGARARQRHQGDPRRPGRRRAVRGLPSLSRPAAQRIARLVPLRRRDPLRARDDEAPGRRHAAHRASLRARGLAGAARFRAAPRRTAAAAAVDRRRVVRRQERLRDRARLACQPAFLP